MEAAEAEGVGVIKAGDWCARGNVDMSTCFVWC
jgi:hypothetical protein